MNSSNAVAEQAPRLRRYARALTRDPVAADDLVQDCLERALAKKRLFTPDTDLRAWLFTIMHNVHIDAVRRNKMTTVSLDEMGDLMVTPPAQEPAIRIRDLAVALERLPDDQREVVLLVGLEGMSYKAVAEVLATPIGTVMSRLARGRDRLRTLMDEPGPPALRSVK